VMVVNKGAATASTTVTLANAAHGAASEMWQLTSANAITRLADAPFSAAHALTATLPAQSVTLFVIPRGTSPTGPPAAPTGVRVVP